VRLHRWSSREGNRGIRAFARVLADGDTLELVDARFEGYIASGAKHAGIGLRADEDSAGVQFFVGVPHVANAWVTVGSWPFSKWLRERGIELPDVNIVDVSFHGRAVWWELWHDKWGWTSGTPRWRSGNWHWWDAITGKPVMTKDVVEGPVEADVPMPEGCYRCTVEIVKRTWKRPRWPWPKVAYGYMLDVISRPGPDGPYIPEPDDDGKRRDGYIPVPGKGENSWDCGPDGTFGQSGPGRTVEQAIVGVVESVLRDRRRRVGTHAYAEPIS
jgi:hypothetical protein